MRIHATFAVILLLFILLLAGAAIGFGLWMLRRRDKDDGSRD